MNEVITKCTCSENGFSLALGGGGGKGAYQIGVFRALHEMGLVHNLKAVAGTSVGALNAVLFAFGDYELAESIWDSISPQTLLAPNYEFLERFLTDKKRDSGVSPELRSILENGICSRQGLRDLLAGLDLPRLKDSIDVYVNMRDTHTNCTECRRLNDLSPDEMIDVLLASSAMPFIYAYVEIGEGSYGDGSFPLSGKVPVQALYDRGFKNILAVPLDENYRFPHQYDEKDSCIAAIIPSESLGGPRGILDFTNDGIHEKMALGYKDAMDYLSGKKQIKIKSHQKGSGITMGALSVKTAIEVGLKIISSMGGEDLLKNVAESDLIMPTIKIKAMNGHFFWNVLKSCNRWELQQNTITQSCRIVDPEGRRVAWGTYNGMLKVMERLETAQTAGRSHNVSSEPGIDPGSIPVSKQIQTVMSVIFDSSEKLDAFVNKAPGLPSVPMPVLPETFFHSVYADVPGWRLEQHDITGHYRLIKKEGSCWVRQAWWGSADDCLRSLEEFY